jgi:hypothetical protein
MNLVYCRGVGCKALIGFIRTEAGKPMPVDPLKQVVRLKVGAASGPGKRITLITLKGKVVAGQACDPSEGEEVSGYVPHHSTCPAATQFRTAVRRTAPTTV